MNTNNTKKVSITAQTVLARTMVRSMTRSELRASAKVLGVRVGQYDEHTRENLIAAIVAGKAGVKFVGHLYAPDALGNPRGRCFFIKKLRTYKGSKVLFATFPPSQTPVIA
jgi:hypothetical protein